MARTIYGYADKLWEPVHEYTYTGEAKQFTLTPAKYLLVCKGAKGADTSGNVWGYGATAYGVLNVTSDMNLYAFVGGNGASYSNNVGGAGGWNGGGNGGNGYSTYNGGGGGGGASDIRLNIDETQVPLTTGTETLPEGYFSLPGIRSKASDGTTAMGYIDTGYVMKSNSTIDAKITLHTETTSLGNFACLFGARSGLGAQDTFDFFGRWRGASYSGAQLNANEVTGSKSYPKDVPVTITSTNNSITWTSESDTETLTGSSAITDGVNTLSIFCLHGESSYYDRAAMTLHYFKIYEDSTLVHHFVPVLRNSDSVVGVYDVITNEFITTPENTYLYNTAEMTTKSLLSRIIVAAGGGGWATHYSYMTACVCAGGGNYGGHICNTSGSASSDPSYGKRATQTSGHSFGIGQSAKAKTTSDSYGAEGAGGGGGGWFGGYAMCAGNYTYSSLPGVGGSSYVLTNSSYKPATYIPSSLYHMTNACTQPCQSDAGFVGIYREIKVPSVDDTILFPFTGGPCKFNAFPGKYVLKCWGGEGGIRMSSPSYKNRCYGGYSEGTLSLEVTTPLYAYVGGSGLFYDYFNSVLKEYNPDMGYNGGGTVVPGSPQPQPGGGASDIRLYSDVEATTNESLLSRIIVAGGAGGLGATNKPFIGTGGGTSGGSTSNSDGYGNNTGGGTQTGIGTSSSGGHDEILAGFGYGGSGITYGGGAGGAGGGGWFGGSGTYPDGSVDDDRAGSGGSGYVLTDSSYKPDGYIPTEDFYLSDATTTAGGNTLMPNMTKIEIDVLEVSSVYFIMKDEDGYKKFDTETETWVWFSDDPTDEEIEEVASSSVVNLEGLKDEFEIVCLDPDNLITKINYSFIPKAQSIKFEIPSEFFIQDKYIDASYDPLKYSIKDKIIPKDSTNKIYKITVEKKQETNDPFKLYSIQLFTK